MTDGDTIINNLNNSDIKKLQKNPKITPYSNSNSYSKSNSNSNSKSKIKFGFGFKEFKIR